MGNISSAFQDALAAQAKAALVEVVAGNPKITVSDLRHLFASNPNLGNLTLGELLGAGPKADPGRGDRRKGAAAPAAPVGAPRKAAGGAHKGGAHKGGAHKGDAHKRNVRTEAGRDAFEAEVLSTLKDQGGHHVAATQLRTALDADPTQLRTALNHLIERGIVTFTGKARGTRYSIAEE